jgi:hypothetical protein
VEAMKKLSLFIAIAALSTVSSAGMARAATTLGSVAQPLGSDPNGCGVDQVLAQATSDAGTPYTVPGPGTITRWGTNGSQSNPGSAVTLVVLKPAAASFSVLGTDAETIPDAPIDSLLSWKIRSPINVRGGETFGLYTDQVGGVACFFTGGQTPAGDTLAALGAASPPGSGQTLSRVIADSPPSFTMNLAAIFTPATGKKCKKKKHKRSAESAKKKKCKGKKKKRKRLGDAR